MTYLRNTFLEMLMGVECMDPEVRRERCVGNGDVEVVNVDRGIEAMGTDGASWEGTRLEKSRNQGRFPGEARFFAQRPAPSFLAQVLTLRTAYPTGYLSSKPFSHSLPPWQPPDTLVWTSFCSVVTAGPPAQ